MSQFALKFKLGFSMAATIFFGGLLTGPVEATEYNDWSAYFEDDQCVAETITESDFALSYFSAPSSGFYSLAIFSAYPLPLRISGGRYTIQFLFEDGEKAFSNGTVRGGGAIVEIEPTSELNRLMMKKRRMTVGIEGVEFVAFSLFGAERAFKAFVRCIKEAG